MKQLKLLLILFLFSQTLLFANMAKPTVDGSTGSTLLGSKDCDVISERIDITAITKYNEYQLFDLHYKVSYKIKSAKTANLPLLFIGTGLTTPDYIMVNGKKVNYQSSNKNSIDKFPFLKPVNDIGTEKRVSFDGETDYRIPVDGNLYFDAPIVEGENTITLEYIGTPEYNIYGILRKFKIEYALYPSKYWKSFGPITVFLHLTPDTEFRSTNIGDAKKLENNVYEINIDHLTHDNLEIVYSKKISLLAKLLIMLDPFGISCICFVLMAYLHYRWVVKVRKKRPKKFNYTVLLGSLIISILYSLIYIFSFDLIDWLVDEQGMKHGYILLAIFIMTPFAFMIELTFSWYIDFRSKRKINKVEVQNN